VTLFLRVLEGAPSPQRLGRMKKRLEVRFDAMTARKYIDMRSLLQARLMCANPHAAGAIQALVQNEWRPIASSFESKMLDRLFGP